MVLTRRCGAKTNLDVTMSEHLAPDIEDDEGNYNTINRPKSITSHFIVIV
jgi:hypothetical protein